MSFTFSQMTNVNVCPLENNLRTFVKFVCVKSHDPRASFAAFRPEYSSVLIVTLDIRRASCVKRREEMCRGAPSWTNLSLPDPCDRGDESGVSG